MPVTVPDPPAGRILLVDDHLYVRQMLRERLMLARYAVTAVATAEEALVVFRAGMIDLVLTDLNLAGPSGFALAAAIRRSGSKGAHVPILGMTAGRSRDDFGRCKAAGISAIIVKPFTLDSFVRTAGRLCAQRPFIGPRTSPASMRARQPL